MLSVPSYGLLGGKISLFSDGSPPLHTFEERITIAQYDGHQNTIQGQRIAYQDAFIAVLATLSYEENNEKDWLEQRIEAAREWLASQDVEQPE